LWLFYEPLFTLQAEVTLTIAAALLALAATEELARILFVRAYLKRNLPVTLATPLFFWVGFVLLEVALGVFQGFSLWLLIPLLFHFCATFFTFSFLSRRPITFLFGILTLVHWLVNLLLLVYS
jgi:hypothetical protein